MQTGTMRVGPADSQLSRKLPPHPPLNFLPLPADKIASALKISTETRRTRHIDASHLPQRGTLGGGCDAAWCRVGPEMHPVGAAAGSGWLPPSGGVTDARWARFGMRGLRRLRQFVGYVDRVTQEIYFSGKGGVESSIASVCPKN